MSEHGQGGSGGSSLAPLGESASVRAGGNGISGKVLICEFKPVRPRGIRARVAGWYWSFVLWCILDSGVGALERWSDRRIHKGGGK